MKSWPANDYRQSSGLLIDRFGETITQQSEAAQFEGHCCLTVESSHKENERAISIAEEGFSSCLQALLTLGRRSGSLVSAKHSIDPDACRCERKIGVRVTTRCGQSSSLGCVLLTWNVGIGRMIVRVGTLELGPGGTLADHNVVGLAAAF